MPRIWFLILRHHVWLLAPFMIMCLLCNLGTSLLCPMFLLRELCRYLLGKTKKAGRATVFLYWHLWAFTGVILPLHMMSFPYCMFWLFFLIKKKLENLQDFFFLGCLDIVCISNWYLNSVSINLLCLDIFESIWLFWPSYFSWLCKSRIAPHAMKKCTIRDFLKVHHSFSNYLLLEILNKRRGLW
jgi:hypothetical protein